MSVENRVQPQAKPAPSLAKTLASIFLSTLVVVGGLVIITAVVMTPVGQTLAGSLNQFFAADSVQLWWYVTRAAGIVAFLLLWFSTVLGLSVSSKQLEKLLDRMFTYDFHEFISLLSIGFLLLHIVVLMLDRYLPYNLLQVLVPFLSPYRPLWVGIGVLAAYLIVLVTVTFYLRNKIGQKTFRTIHILSLLSYLGATLHGLYAGTDAVLPAMKLLYEGTGLVVIFMMVYWLVMQYFKRAEARAKAPVANPAYRRHAGTRS
jgi:sulfoxide reductase heme-binding subunit YedZ